MGRNVAPPQPPSSLIVSCRLPPLNTESGHFSEAASHLESLLRQVPDSFEVHELLGLVYSAQSQERAAKEHFERAVQLKPDSGVARTNLATNLVRLGMYSPAEEQFAQAVKLEPRSYDANHNLGRVLHSVR